MTIEDKNPQSRVEMLKTIDPKEYLELGFQFHGHKCPAMPMGLRVGAAAMNKLGVGRTGDGEWEALVEIGDDHCATCFADGVQVITGCTLGKGNIKKVNIGKWGLTLINKKTQEAVRVVPKGEAMLQNKESAFMRDYRSKGVPATKVPDAVVQPMVENVMNLPDEMLLTIGDVVAHPYRQKAHSFDGFICEECGEMVVEQFGRVKGDKKVCISCLGWDLA